jgi:hypothetical protein
MTSISLAYCAGRALRIWRELPDHLAEMALFIVSSGCRVDVP